MINKLKIAFCALGVLSIVIAPILVVISMIMSITYLDFVIYGLVIFYFISWACYNYRLKYTIKWPNESYIEDDENE